MTKTAPPRNLVKATADHVYYLCRNMRPDEIDQLRAFYAVDGDDGQFDADAVAAMLMVKQGPRYTVLQDDGVPAVSFGLELVHDGVWQPWMVGTMHGWATSWRSITRSCRLVRDALFADPHNRRVQMSALTSRAAACQWYERGLGMAFEGVMRGFGRNGEDIAMYSVLRGADPVGIDKDKFNKVTDPLNLAGGKAAKWADPLGIIYKEKDTTAADAARAEAARQAQITKTIGEIDALYDSPDRQKQISQYGSDLLAQLTSGINEQKQVADRELKFALARSGQTGGSVATDQNKQLGNDYQKAILDAARKSQAGMADLKGQDAQSRLNLIALAQQGLSSGSAAAQAAASMSATLDGASREAQSQQWGDLFAGAANAKKYSEAAKQQRLADRNYATLYPGATSFNAGGFR